MSATQWFELGKIVLDKGALALVLLFGTWLLNRSLEKYKASQARTTELSRERLTLARRLVADARDIEERSLKLKSFLEYQSFAYGSTLEPNERFHSDVRELEAAQDRLAVLVSEADLFFPPPVVETFQAFVTASRDIRAHAKAEQTSGAFAALAKARQSALATVRSVL